MSWSGYIPGSMLREYVEFRAVKPRCYGSRAGNGHQTPSTAYPNQGVDLTTRLYGSESPTVRAILLPAFRSLGEKYAGLVTPFGSLVSDVVRSDATGIIASKCGYCNELLSRRQCNCHKGATTNVDDFKASPVPAHRRDSAADSASRRKVTQSTWRGEDD